MAEPLGLVTEQRIEHTTQLQQFLDQLGQGNDKAVFEKIVQHSNRRLYLLARRMLHRHERVRRWVETDDVLQNALIRLHRALAEVCPQSPREFYGLAAVQIRRELIDLARHYFGKRGLGANHHSNGGVLPENGDADSLEPETLEDWERFHCAVDLLPGEQRQVVDLLWYEGLTQAQAAAVLGVSVATVKRRWQAARITLGEQLKGASFG